MNSPVLTELLARDLKKKGHTSRVYHHRQPKLSMSVLKIINTCGILSNPQNGREYKGFVWEFR